MSFYKLRIKSHSSFKFVRGLFVIYGTFSEADSEGNTNKPRTNVEQDS